MKGLMLKDIYGVGFQIIAGLLILLFPNVMIFFAGGGMFAAGDGTESQQLMLQYSGIFYYGMVNYISITICSSFLLNTVGADEKSGWAKMQRAMPVTGGEIIGAKLIVTGCILAVLTLISMFFNLLGTVLFGMPAEPMIAIPVCIALLQVTTLSPTFVFGYKFGAKFTEIFYLCATVFVAVLAVGLVVLSMNNGISAVFLRILAYAAVPALAAAMVVICYHMGKKAAAVDI